MKDKIKRFKVIIYPTWKANDILIKIDRGLVGTSKYLGLAYFWSTDYKHVLRELEPHLLIKIHDEFLKNNLNVWGSSLEHEKIIAKFAVRSRHYTKAYGKKFSASEFLDFHANKRKENLKTLRSLYENGKMGKV